MFHIPLYYLCNMKRIITLLLGAFLFFAGSISLGAQTIIGSWTTVQSDKNSDKASGLDMSAKVADTLSFHNGGKYIEKLGMEMNLASGKESYSFTIYFTINGNWTLDGNTLTTVFPKKGIKADVTSTDIPKVLMGIIKNSLAKEMKEAAGEETVYTVEKLTADTMVLKTTDEDGESDTSTYKRIK